MTDNICPYLGSLGDPLSCTTCASEDNLCYARGEGELIAKAHQKKYCLGGKLTSCPHFPAESTLSTFSGPLPNMVHTVPAAETVDQLPVHTVRTSGLKAFSAPPHDDDNGAEDLDSLDLDDIDEFLDAAAEDSYFDVVEDAEGGDAVGHDDFYFDELKDADATSKTTHLTKDSALVSGETVEMDPREIRAHAGTISTASFVRSASPHEAPSTIPPQPMASGPAGDVLGAPAGPDVANSFYDSTVAVSTVSPPSREANSAPRSVSPATRQPPVGMPEPAHPVSKEHSETTGHKERAGVDPAWLARRLAEQVESLPGPKKPAPSSTRVPPEPIIQAPKVVTPLQPTPAPEPASSQAVSQSVLPSEIKVPERLSVMGTKLPPERLAPHPRARSNFLLYLAASVAGIALVLLCVGAYLLRDNLLPALMPANVALQGALEPMITSGPFTPIQSVALITPTTPLVTVTSDVSAIMGLEPTTALSAALPAIDTAVTPKGPNEAVVTTYTPEPTKLPLLPLVTLSATSSAMPSPTDTVSPTPKPSDTASPTLEPTDTSTPTFTPQPTNTATQTMTPEPSATATSMPLPTNTPAQPQTYVVKEGDTPSGIAAAVGISVKTLLAANPGLDPLRLRIGQELKIPSPRQTLSEPVTAVSPTAIPSVYVIKSGDTLAAIARELDVSVDDLLAANPNVDPKLLKPGQELRIPSGGQLATLHTSMTALTTNPATPVTTTTHTVQSGESLLAIAIRYRLNVDDILKANPGIDPRRLQIGQKIRIPAVADVPGQSRMPTRIVAASIGLDAEVVSITTRTEMQEGVQVSVWDEPNGAAGYHVNSASPGSSGNVVISGKSGATQVFNRIAELTEGAEVQLTAGGQIYTYRVERVFMLPDKYISAEKRRANETWLAPTVDARLTLVSYWPPENPTQRLIVIAKPVIQ